MISTSQMIGEAWACSEHTLLSRGLLFGVAESWRVETGVESGKMCHLLTAAPDIEVPLILDNNSWQSSLKLRFLPVASSTADTCLSVTVSMNVDLPFQRQGNVFFVKCGPTETTRLCVTSSVGLAKSLQPSWFELLT